MFTVRHENLALSWMEWILEPIKMLRLSLLKAHSCETNNTNSGYGIWRKRVKTSGAHLVGDGERDVGKVLEHADPLGRVVVDAEQVDVVVDVEGVDEVEVGGDLGEDGVRVGLDEGPGVAVGLVRADAGAHEHLGLAGEHEEGAVLRAGGGQGRQIVGKLYF